jgi:nitrogenase molybdenum-iron protein alpha/beta subunit
MEFKEFIKKQRHNARHYQKDTKGKDIEYGRCCGRIGEIANVLEREDVEVDPLQMGIRGCPFFVAFWLSYLVPGWHALLHGTEGCAYQLRIFLDQYFVMFRDRGNISATVMGKVDAILGAEEKLKKAITEIDRDHQPEVIAVLKSCASSIIGDDIKGVCDSLKDKVNCRLMPLDMTSFASRHFGLGRDKLLLAMAEEFIEPPKEKIPYSINLIGDTCALHPPEFRPPNDPEEIARVLNNMGATVHCFLPGREPISKIATASSASLNVLVCGVAGLGFGRYMEEKYGVPYVTVNRPIGIAASTQFYLSIIDALGLGGKAEKALQDEITQTDKALDPYRKKLHGKRCAISLASGRIVGQALLTMELGMEPVFLGIHSLHEKLFPGLDILAGVLAEKGYEPEVVVEPNFYEELEVMDRLKPDVWYLDGAQKNMSIRYGQPWVNSMAEAFGGPQMGFRGSLSWAEQTAMVVENAAIYRKIAKPDLYRLKSH